MLTTRNRKHSYQKVGCTPTGMQKNLRRFENEMVDSKQKYIDIKKLNALEQANLKHSSLPRVKENELYNKRDDPIASLLAS